MNTNLHYTLVMRFIIPILFCFLHASQVSAQIPQTLLSALSKTIPDSLFCEDNYIQLIEKSTREYKPQRVYFRADSAGIPNYICQNIDYTHDFQFINHPKNYIQWHDLKSIKSFFSSLEQTACRKLNVLHIGDSHVQFDLITGTIRKRLQQAFGNGGRGMVFPLSILHTNTAYDYDTSYRGRWLTARNVQRRPQLDLGVSGATVKTFDSVASFKFRFHKQYKSVKKNYRKIKIYCKQHPTSFDLAVKFSDKEPPIIVDCSDSTCKPYIEVMLPEIGNKLEFEVRKHKNTQSFFELYGVTMESAKNQGVVYSSVGINGAGLSGVLRQKLMPEQIKSMSPDLIVVDLGVNDLVPHRVDMNYQETRLQKVVDFLKSNAPKSSILLVSTQDAYRRGRNIGECYQYAQIIRRVAKRNQCAFYDFYDIGGGSFSMNKWFSCNLAQPDKLHLTSKGYRLKGKLYANAILNSYHSYLTKSNRDSLIFDLTPKKKIKRDILPTSKIVAKKPRRVTKHKVKRVTAVSKKKITHLVKSGQSLSYLSDKYNAYIKDIQRWNGLKTVKIRIGQKLIIYPNSVKNNPKTKKKITKNHTVRRGDSLWIIAQRYGTDVPSLKKLNKLSDTRLSVGQKIQVK